MNDKLKEILSRYFPEADGLTLQGAFLEIKSLLQDSIEEAEEAVDSHWRRLDEEGKL